MFLPDVTSATVIASMSATGPGMNTTRRVPIEGTAEGRVIAMGLLLVSFHGGDALPAHADVQLGAARARRLRVSGDLRELLGVEILDGQIELVTRFLVLHAH